VGSDDNLCVGPRNGSRPLVLVGHSYAGKVISIAASGRDDVSHLVYVAAAMIGGDESLMEKSAEFPPTVLGERVQVSEDGAVTVDPEAALACFYNECDRQDAESAASSLRPTALECMISLTGSEPWRTIPSTYIVCRRDQAIHPDFQRHMAKRAGKTVELDADHSPFMSRPEEFLGILLEV
jgi:pimeloyl-ACP methyl ester carboxylesterase